MLEDLDLWMLTTSSCGEVGCCGGLGGWVVGEGGRGGKGVGEEGGGMGR